MSTLTSGWMPPSVDRPSASYIGQAEKRKCHPLGSSALKGSPAPAPRLIADNRYVRQTFKKGYKTIGGAERASVGEDAIFFCQRRPAKGRIVIGRIAEKS